MSGASALPQCMTNDCDRLPPLTESSFTQITADCPVLSHSSTVWGSTSPPLAVFEKRRSDPSALAWEKSKLSAFRTTASGKFFTSRFTLAPPGEVSILMTL